MSCRCSKRCPACDVRLDGRAFGTPVQDAVDGRYVVDEDNGIDFLTMNMSMFDLRVLE